MTARVLTGSKQEIAAKLAGIDGEVREAIVFVDEPPTPPAAVPAAGAAGIATDADPFAEMEPYTVATDDVDDSRDSIYSRGEGE